MLTKHFAYVCILCTCLRQSCACFTTCMQILHDFVKGSTTGVLGQLLGISPNILKWSNNIRHVDGIAWSCASH